jgi:hypothetical protein
MYDWIFFPVMGLILQCETFEKMFLVLEDGFQRGQGQGFPETAGTRQKINALGRFQQLPQAFRFVHIEEIPAYEVFKSIYAGRQVFHFMHPNLFKVRI